jgi:hypothetical protein
MHFLYCVGVRLTSKKIIMLPYSLQMRKNAYLPCKGLRRMVITPAYVSFIKPISYNYTSVQITMLARQFMLLIFVSVMALCAAQDLATLGTGGAFLAGLALPIILNQFRRPPLPVVVPYPIQYNYPRSPYMNPFPGQRPFYPGTQI